MDTYSLLREFADSWMLMAMTAFFIGMVAFTFRPGSRAHHDQIASVVLRNDTLPDERGETPKTSMAMESTNERA